MQKNKENILSKSFNKPKNNILGFSWTIFLFIILVFCLQMYIGSKINSPTNKSGHVAPISIEGWHNLMSTLLCALLLSSFFNFIGKKTPILKDIGGGSILCLLVPSFLITFPFHNDTNINSWEKSTFYQFRHFIGEKMEFLNKSSGIGFSAFIVSALIVGSLLNIDSSFLKKLLKRFLPLVLISLLIGGLVTTLFGGLLGYLGFAPIRGITDSPNSTHSAFLDTFYYIFVPLAGGGMTAGIVPLSSTFSKVLAIPNESTVTSHIFPALLIGGIFSIICAGVIKKIFLNTKYNGNGQLEKNNLESNKKSVNKTNTKKTISLIDYYNIQTGLVAIFALYTFSNLIRNLLKTFFPESKLIPESLVFIVFVVIIIKILNFINEYYLNCIQQASKLISTNFVSALLVILGCTLKMEDALSHFNIPFILTCFCSVLTVATTAFIVGNYFNFYALEASVTAGLCVNSIGGAGNLNILAASGLMPLSPFSQISTRLGGAIVVLFASLTYSFFYFA